jgi:alkylation response protein AidB-like acyl-CoA dehydrogenase
MASAQHYKSNLRDIFFNLFEVFATQDEVLGHGPYAPMDETSAREALTAFDQFVKSEIAPCYAECDRIGLLRDADGEVHLPESMKRAMSAFFDAGWDRLEQPERLGGFGAPPSVIWSSFELKAGSHASLTFYLFGGFVARTIDRLGTESQRKRYVGNMLERKWAGAMVLTEPEAGSDVGAARTKARHIAGDVWEIEGTKRFITNGELDAAENVVHLVLARPEGAGPGTKGLSMFIVPKIWVEEDGSLGPRNGVFCSAIEKKMGIKASSTCEMTYGDRGQARGLLVGEIHEGIRQMFHVIEHARMAVGVKSMATLSTAYLNALQYAHERKQGADLLRAGEKTAPRVELIRHPDVRRMLMMQKAHAEGMRALCMFTASIQDRVELRGGHASKEAAELDRLNDLLLPLVKGYCSEKAAEMLSLSLQCFGGSGYCQDFPIEQYVRDQRIDALYEGTTHIQALDFFFRKVAKDGGATLMALLGRIAQTEAPPSLAFEKDAVARALADVQAIFAAMMGKIGESPYHAGLQGNRILFAVAELVIGWLLLRQAIVARRKLDGAPVESERGFYTGKLAIARFFASNVLPGTALSRRLVEESALDLMQLDDAAF